MTENRPLLDTVIEMTASSVEHSNLNARELMLVRTAALAASDASTGSYLLNLSADVASGLTLDDAQGILIAVAPIIGTPRTRVRSHGDGRGARTGSRHQRCR